MHRNTGEPGPSRDAHPSALGGLADEPADPTLARAAAALRQLPTARPGAVDRVVAAALVHNGAAGTGHGRPRWLARAAAVVVAAGLGAASLYGVQRIAARDDVPATEMAAAAASPAGATPPLAAPSFARPAAAADEDAPVATGFALARPGARSVTIIGDFNGWDANATPLARDARGVWTTTVALRPGRHAYVFVVDDSVWVTDPRAEVVRDADYGRDQSVIVVGRP